MIVVDCTQYSGKPDAATMQRQYGVLPGRCPSAAVTCTPADPATGSRYIEVARLRHEADLAQIAGAVLILDIEDVRAAENMLDAIALVRNFDRRIVLGSYAVGPALGPAAQQASQFTYLLSRFLRLQSPFSDLSDLLDVICPCLYLSGDPQVDAQTAALALTFATVRWPGKLILPFVSDRINGDSNARLTTHDENFAIFEAVNAVADGCVLWTNPGEAWDANADFLASAKRYATPAPKNGVMAAVKARLHL